MNVTDGDVKKFKSEYVYAKMKASSWGGGGAHSLYPPPRSAPEFALSNKVILLIELGYFCTQALRESLTIARDEVAALKEERYTFAYVVISDWHWFLDYFHFYLNVLINNPNVFEQRDDDFCSP